jgi:hypothetical protein
MTKSLRMRKQLPHRRKAPADPLQGINPKLIALAAKLPEQMGKIIDAEDILSRALDLVECASCTVVHLWRNEADHVDSVLEIASERINAAIELLEAYRNETGFGPKPLERDAT